MTLPAMRLVRLLSLTIILVKSVRSQFTECFPENRPATSVQADVDGFGLNLFRTIANMKRFENVFLSPYSIRSVLSIAYMGADGNTKHEMEKALGIYPSKQMEFSNAITLHFLLTYNQSGVIFNKVDKAYFSHTLPVRKCVKEILHSIETINFSNADKAADLINEVIKNATNGKFEKFVEPNSLTGVDFLLLNAVYFKGLWETQFERGSTALKEFYDESESRSLGIVQMMTILGDYKYANIPGLRASIIELPYKLSTISMYLVLPNKTSLASVLNKLNPGLLNEVIVRMPITKIFLSLPKFKMTSRYSSDLKAALREIGIVDLFKPGRANLNGFSYVPLHVDETHHIATVEVNEEGTVAAAVTAFFGIRSGTSLPLAFNCNHPFIFLIRENSRNVTLFAGVFRDPTAIEALP